MHFNNDFDNDLQGEPTNNTQDLQDATQWWDKLLHETGGKLELQKCFFYHLKWEFDKDGKPKLALTKDNIHITSSETGETIHIQQKKPIE